MGLLLIGAIWAESSILLAQGEWTLHEMVGTSRASAELRGEGEADFYPLVQVSFEYLERSNSSSTNIEGVEQTGIEFRNLKVVVEGIGEFSRLGEIQSLKDVSSNLLGVSYDWILYDNVELDFDGAGAFPFGLDSAMHEAIEAIAAKELDEVETSALLDNLWRIGDDWGGLSMDWITGFYLGMDPFGFQLKLDLSLPGLPKRFLTQVIDGEPANGGFPESVSLSNNLGVSCYDEGLKRPDNVWASQGKFRDKIVVEWDSVEGAEAYAIYSSKCQLILPVSPVIVEIGVQPPGHEDFRIGTVSGSVLSFEDYNVEPNLVCSKATSGVGYFYWVRAISGGCLGQSAIIPIALGFRSIGPAHSLEASPAAFGGVELKWKVPRGTNQWDVFRSDSESFELAERVDRIQRFAIPTTVDDQIVTWTDSSVQKDTAYYYWVRAGYVGGSTGVSEMALGFFGELNPNRPPSKIMLNRNGVDENQEPGAVVGLLTVEDPDKEDAFIYSIVPSGAALRGPFGIRGDQLVTTAVLDFEKQRSYSVTIRVEDSAGHVLDGEFEISVIDFEEEAVPLPVIVVHPEGATIEEGSVYTMGVEALGEDLAYQWHFNGGALPNHRGTSIQIRFADKSREGLYGVKVTGPSGSVFSRTAQILVIEPGPNPDNSVGGGMIGGVRDVTESEGPNSRPEAEGASHPADQNEDFVISILEVTQYADAWKKGENWPSGPNPIPIVYVTSAGTLWRGGESYARDPSKPEAPGWWVNGE